MMKQYETIKHYQIYTIYLRMNNNNINNNNSNNNRENFLSI